MNYLRLLFIIGILFSAQAIYAQGENNFWIWGVKNQLDFNQSPPVYSDTVNINSMESSACVSDENGNLLFYTMGNQIWNKLGNPMPNATGLLGNDQTSCMWGVQIIPNLSNPNQYYVFSGDPGYVFDRKIYYHIVDMSLNNGLGDVVQKNIVFFENWKSNEGMYVFYGSCRSYWLVVVQSRPNADSILAFKIDENGIDLNPVVSIPNAPGNSFVGYTSVYQKTGLAVSIKEGGVMLHRFDRNTGQFSDFELLINNGSTLQSLYNVRNMIAFSPNGKYLYFYGRLINSQLSGLTQFDLSHYPNVAEIINTRIEVMNGRFVTMKYGPDKKLYLFGPSMSAIGMFDIDVISTPDLPMTASSIDYNVISGPLLSSSSQLLNPEFLPIKKVPDTFASALPVLDSVICAGSSFEISSPKLGMTNYIWNDGSTGNTKVVNMPGTYWVYSLYNDCEVYVDTFKFSLFHVELIPKEDTFFCEGTVLRLDAFDDMYETYLWNTGETSAQIEVSNEGQYYVTVGANGCFASDSIYVSKITPVLNILQNDTTICETSSITLTAKTNMESAIFWNNGSSASSINVNTAGQYTAYTQNICGLQKDSVQIDVINCDCIPLFANAFTPNGDGINDVFFPLFKTACMIKAYELTIYNRYGQVVFTNTKMGVGWDGTYKDGRTAEIGVYYYRLKVSNNFGNIETSLYKGEVSLIR